MKTRSPFALRTSLFALLLLLSTLNPQLSTLFAQGTAFTYQGRLNDGASPANGIYDLRFMIYDSTNNPGVLIAGPLTNSATAISNGLFTVMLDFGAGVFTGPDRWLEIGVRSNGIGDFVALSPRQPLTPTPYAIFANTSSNLSGTLPAVQLSGSVSNSQLAHNSITVNAGAGLSGGGTVALGGSTALSNAGVLSATGNADILASTLNGAVTLASSATNANVASRIVKRDASGNFSAGSVTLAGNLTLPTTSAGAGIIFSSGNTLLHTFGSQNTFAGVLAGNLTLSGTHNTGFGSGTLNRNTSGIRNTASGAFALFNNTTGGDNTAHGISALLNNTNGSFNTGLGAQALVLNTSGNNNTAVGAFALNDNAGGSDNTAVGRAALGSNTQGGGNTAVGVLALSANTTAFDNTAVGQYALFQNTSGNRNTACGQQALSGNTTGFDNTALGASAMFLNTVGTHNTAVGSQALTASTNGSFNTALGASALANNLSGYDNNAWGYTAMNQNLDGANNVAAGFQTLYNNTNGSFNAAFGNNALLANKSGSQNTAIGYSALGSATSHDNIALGYVAGLLVTTGGTNIHIGNLGSSSDTNLIRIGSSQTRTFIAGISGATASGGVAVFVNGSGQLGTLTSSARYKQDIHKMAEASDALYSLRPVTFRYKPEVDPLGIPQFGLVAEEVAKVNPDLVVRNQNNEIQTVRYEAVNAMLLNEFLEEHDRIKKQAVEITTQRAQLEELSRKLDAQSSENGELKQRLAALERIIRDRKSN